MIDPKLIRENPQQVQNGAKNKGVDINVDEIIKLDEEVRKLKTDLQKLQGERNEAARAKDIEKGKSLKDTIKSKEDELKELEPKLEELLYSIPNLPAPDVKEGKNETENEVVKTQGEPTKFGFTPRDHIELGKLLDIIDIERATKVSGARFSYLKNEGALLEIAIVQYAMQVLTKEGFTPVIPPTLIKTETMKALGYMEGGGAEDMFHLEKDNLHLVGTAEHALVPMHMDETFKNEELPKRYAGFSSAFRREAGSYGKDTKGIIRVHQFDKVEMVSFTTKEESEKELDYLLAVEEKFFQSLGIPYQVVKMCTGDLGFPAAKKIDIEAWIPTQEKYREVTSVSTVTDFQSRRLNIKYLSDGKKEYAHVLNGTAFAIGRTLVAILENHQQEDGSVVIPEVLRPYTGFDRIEPK